MRCTIYADGSLRLKGILVVVRLVEGENSLTKLMWDLMNQFRSKFGNCKYSIVKKVQRVAPCTRSRQLIGLSKKRPL